MSNEISIIESKNNEIARLTKLLESAKSERQDIAILGDGEVFLRRTPSGGVKSVVGAVTLQEELGEIYEIPGYGDTPSKYPITAIGYNKLNQVAGISIVTPKSLRLENGSNVVNPYIMRDENNVIQGVWVRKVSIGMSPTGNIAMVSSTLQYNVGQYLIADLTKKVKNDSKAGKLCNVKSLTQDELIKGQFFSLYGDTGLWVNFDSKDVFKVFETYTQNCLFAERKAQTICERNVLKKHPAFSQMYVVPQGRTPKRFAKVRVVGWTCDLTEKELERLADQADDSGEITINGQKVQYVDAFDVVEDEDVTASCDEEETTVRDDDESENIKVQQDPGPSQASYKEVDDFSLYDDIERAAATLGSEKTAAILKKNMRTSFDALKPAQYKMALQLLNEEIEKGASK